MTDAPFTSTDSRHVPAAQRDQAKPKRMAALRTGDAKTGKYALSVCRSVSAESGLFALPAVLAMKFVLVVN
jgi:hypothetical protein